MKERKNLRNYVRGWFPQEPLPKKYSIKADKPSETKAELDKKLYKNSSIVNPVIVGVFLGINTLLIRPHYNYNVSTEITILSFGIFIATLTTANLLLYWRYKKQLSAKERQ